MRSRLLALACLTLSTLACATTTNPRSMMVKPEITGELPGEGGEGGQREAGQRELVSVKPGVNDRYFEADAIDEWTDKLETERREVIANHDAILAALELRPGMIVADVGVGTGAFVVGLSEAVGETGRVLAVDIVPAFLAHVGARVEAAGLTNVELVEATATDASLDDESVDLLFMCDVYHHIEYPSTYLPTLHRALRPDGRLVIVEFARIPGVTSERMMKHVRQDQATLVAELAAAGFELEREITQVPLDENYMLVFRRRP